MFNFTYDEIFNLQFYINGKIITGIEIEQEFLKYIKNMEIKIVGFNQEGENLLFIEANKDNYYHVRIELSKLYLYDNYYFYIKHIAFNIIDLMGKEYFRRSREYDN